MRSYMQGKIMREANKEGWEKQSEDEREKKKGREREKARERKRGMNIIYVQGEKDIQGD